MSGTKTLSGAGTLSLCWTRSDLPFDQCYEYWRGPHGQLVGHNKSCFSYRQLHFDCENPLVTIPKWKVSQECPKQWIPEGIAECLCTNIIKGIFSKKTKNARLTFKDEKNAFERTLLYMAMPFNAVFDVENATDTELNGKATGERVAILFKHNGRHKRQFKSFMKKQLIPLLKSTPGVIELHSYLFAPYDENGWPGENILHDHPEELQYNAALIVGAKDRETLMNILGGERVSACINHHARLLKLVHIFNIRHALVMRYGNRATIAATRGAQLCDVLMASKAVNQVTDEFIKFMFKRF